jgi:hypothetical protein
MRARRPTPRHTRTSAVISVGVVTALVLAACGSDDGAAPATEPTTTAATTTTTPPAPPTTDTSTTTTTTAAPTTTSAPTTTVVSDQPTLLRYDDDGIVVAVDGTETRIIDGPVGWAASDRAGGIVFTRQGDGTDWGRGGISTWWLPAGATEPRPIEAGGVPDTDPDGSPVLVGRPVSQVAGCDAEQSPVIRHTLATGEETVISCRDELGDSWFWITSAGGGRTALTEGYDVLNISAAGGLVLLDPEGAALDLPGNPYGSCPELSEPWRCDVHGLLSPDGRLIATWYRPDHAIAVKWDDAPPEWADLHTQWLARLGTVPATIRVLELDSGRELFTTEVSAQTRLADFDGRFVVVAPREYTDDQFWTEVRDAPWTVLDTIGGDEPVTVDGPVGLRVMGGSR